MKVLCSFTTMEKLQFICLSLLVIQFRDSRAFDARFCGVIDFRDSSAD
uniref:Uncharacterized protein n=1 Tax=Arundo donax TaxID=35708 RepID=A0A0A9A1K9_ARUDO